MSDPIDIAMGISPRALVIEDVPEDRALTEAMLLARGLTPVTVENLVEAQTAAAGVVPTVIVLSADVRNGFNLCLRFRKDQILKDAPLIMTTAKAGPAVIDKHRKLPNHADEYVRKPLGEDSLGEAIDRLLGSLPVLDVSTDDEIPPDLPMPEESPDAAPPLESAPPDLPKDVPATPDPEVQSAPDATFDSTARPSAPVDTALAKRVESLEDELAEANARHALELAQRDTEVSRLAAELEEARDRSAAMVGQLDAARTSAEEAGPLRAQLTTLEGERDALAGQMETLQSFQAEIEPLRARIAELEDEREVLVTREAKAHSDLEQTTRFFERLEAGYKDSLATAQAEKVAIEEERERSEERAQELGERAEELARLQATLPQLHEAAARAELMAKDFERLQATAEEAKQLRSRVATLETVNQEMETRLGELDTANQAQAAQIGEMVRMKREFAALTRSEAGARKQAEELATHLEHIRAAVLGNEGAQAPGYKGAPENSPVAVIASRDPEPAPLPDENQKDPS